MVEPTKHRIICGALYSTPAQGESVLLEDGRSLLFHHAYATVVDFDKIASVFMHLGYIVAHVLMVDHAEPHGLLLQPPVLPVPMKGKWVAPKDLEVSKALDESIAHWEEICEFKEPIDIGSASCPLCTLILDKRARSQCSGCPVKEYTGHPHCRYTPWVLAFLSKKKYGWDSPQFKIAALEELVFLKDLKQFA